MIILLHTATPLCQLVLVDGDKRYVATWEAGRELAQGLLKFLETQLQEQGSDISSLTGIGVYRGPGSFTGLRIGVAVLNTLADALAVPIVGETGEGWEDRALQRLANGENEQLVMPLYGQDATITLPRK